jgi:Transcriptional regulatory protein, C terminal
MVMGLLIIATPSTQGARPHVPRKWPSGNGGISGSNGTVRAGRELLAILVEDSTAAPRLLLIALLERPGELVTKQELMAQVWPNLFVEPANLTVHISALRRTLRDGRDGNRFIINIPRRGYHFVAPIKKHRCVLDNATAAQIDRR